MKSRKEKSRASRNRRALSLESLERREMMAADAGAISPLAGVLSASAPAPALGPVALGVNQSAAPARSSFSIPFRSVYGPTPVPTRSYDGTGNNLANPDWGSVGEQLVREAPAAYADGVSAPAGVDRPSARDVSVALATQPAEIPNARQMSAYVYAWGQFIDHDMDLTAAPTSNTEEFDVTISAGDPVFDPNSTGDQVIAFTRSRYDSTTGTSADNPRQQVNEITSWIDGSMVYGSSKATSDSLRTFVGGRLKTSTGDLPPTDASGFFVAGDVRANENAELTSMQALFLREHNYWAGKIAAQNPRLSDEQIFQQARSIVIAEIQSITYNGFLPALLGQGALSRYSGYDPTVNPGIANEFSAAAFRLGHSLVNDDVEFFGNDGTPVRPELELKDAFFNPTILPETGIDAILKYLASTQTQELDTQIVNSLQNFVLSGPGGPGMDLAALNIQRGRDHGLADYNTTREAYGLPRVTSFAQITSDPVLQQKLQATYGTVDNIDLWVGALAEDHVRGASVGPLVKAIVGDQFERLRDGDRFWFEKTFSGQQLNQLERTTLADVIERNTTITNLQDNVFFMRAEVSGQAFVDLNGNGRQDRGEIALAGVTLQLINDEGAVIATTTTDRNGRYRFNQFHETGAYQVQLVLPTGMKLTTPGTKDVLISRGNAVVGGLNFGVKLSGVLRGGPRFNARGSFGNPFAALDQAFSDQMR